MQLVPIILLIWLYAVAVMGLINIVLTELQISFSAIYLSIILSLVGVVLGLLFYFLSFLKSKVKIYISITTTIIILLIILIAYLLAGIFGLQFLGLIGFLFIISSVPLVSVYSLLKKQKITFLASGIGIMFFYVFIVILGKLKEGTMVPLYTPYQIELLLLFFVLFLCFLELGSISIYFNNSVDKMMPNKEIDYAALSRFNIVINRYIFHIVLLLILCYVCTILLFWNTSYIGIGDFIGINLSSAYGVLVLVTLSVVSAFVFWLLIPREKVEKSSVSADKK